MLHAVAGNNDYAGAAGWLATDHGLVNSLPRLLRLALPGGELVIEHGHRLGDRPDHARFRSDHGDARMVVYGHTHRRIIDREAEPWVVNPGAAGNTRTRGGPSCLVLIADANNWEIEEFVFADEPVTPA
jgi:predicted phosphodiesterase